MHSPNIDRIELFTRGDVRRAKLYYLRELRGKAAKIKEKRETPFGILTLGAGCRSLVSVALPELPDDRRAQPRRYGAADPSAAPYPPRPPGDPRG